MSSDFEFSPFEIQPLSYPNLNSGNYYLFIIFFTPEKLKTVPRLSEFYHSTLTHLKVT